MSCRDYIFFSVAVLIASPILLFTDREWLGALIVFALYYAMQVEARKDSA